MINTPERIFIIGTSGSGKTTLAKNLSETLSLPHIDLDPVRYPAGRDRLSHEESTEAAKKIAEEEQWIAEGIYLYWVGPLLERADQIIWVDTPKNVAMYRIMKRHLLNRLKRSEEHGFLETIKFALDSRHQHSNKRTELGEEDGQISPIVIAKTLAPFMDKVIKLMKKEDYRNYMRQLSKR